MHCNPIVPICILLFFGIFILMLEIKFKALMQIPIIYFLFIAFYVPNLPIDMLSLLA